MCNRTECCGYCVIKVKVYQSLMGCKHNRMEIYGREHRSQAPGTTKESYRGATPAKILSQDTPAMNITQTSKNNITNITHVFSSQFSYSMPSHVISKKTCKTPTVQYFSHFFLGETSPGSEDFGWIRCRASFGQQDPMPGTGARDGTGGATIGDWCSNWVRWKMVVFKKVVKLRGQSSNVICKRKRNIAMLDSMGMGCNLQKPLGPPRWAAIDSCMA
jgi:hypothetical protein